MPSSTRMSSKSIDLDGLVEAGEGTASDVWQGLSDNATLVF